MPRTLPPHLFLKRFIKRTYDVIALALRATLVAFVWLVVIPYGTVVSWRLYFFLGDMMYVTLLPYTVL
jgi:E3 ubiquitin-protein ligase MARCH6